MIPAATDLASWRESCARETTQAIYAKYGAELQRFGERGKENCQRDILYHLDYLQAALSHNEPSIFVQYALWLKEVLNGRSVPAAHLAYSFDALATFFEARLDADPARAIMAILDAARAAIAQDVQPASYATCRLPALQDAVNYRTLILQGQHRAAMTVVSDAMNSGHSLPQVAVQLVQPALYQVGQLWQKNQITVSQEHLATAISQNVLASAYTQAIFAPSTGKTAMFACVEGNYHGLGVQVLADAFETVGWSVFNFGSNLPLLDLVRQVDAQRPDLLALSMALPSHIAVARMTIEVLRSEMGAACPALWVGGLASVSTPQIWLSTKADGWAADALHALEQF